MRTGLREALVEGRRAGLGTPEGIGSLRCRASGALYALLLLHPVDQHGRCQSCRRPGALFSWRRRPCAVHQEASFWLRKHAWFLASREMPGVPIVPLTPNNHGAPPDTQDGDAPEHPGRHRRPTPQPPPP
jgi:hypothetical protein